MMIACPHIPKMSKGLIQSNESALLGLMHYICVQAFHHVNLNYNFNYVVRFILNFSPPSLLTFQLMSPSFVMSNVTL